MRRLRATAWEATAGLESYPLIVADGSGVPGKIGAMVNKMFTPIRTNGDGACGIHAFFGSDSHRGLYQADARIFLRQSLGCSARDVRRNAGSLRGGVLCRLMNRLWYDVMKPQAEFDATVRDALPHLDPEERRVWECMKQDPQLVSACSAAVIEDQRKKNSGGERYRYRYLQPFWHSWVSWISLVATAGFAATFWPERFQGEVREVAVRCLFVLPGMSLKRKEQLWWKLSGLCAAKT